MKTIFACLFAFVSLSVCATDLPKDVRDVRLSYAEYRRIPTKTEIRQRPNCIPHGQRHPVDCEDVVVLESKPVVTVYVNYFDPTFPERGHLPSTIEFHYAPDEFPAEDLESLKVSVWRRIFSTRGEKFAKKFFEVAVADVQRTVMVVDRENSDLCPINRNRYPDADPRCQERVVYKPAKVWVKEVTLLKKN